MDKHGAAEKTRRSRSLAARKLTAARSLPKLGTPSRFGSGAAGAKTPQVQRRRRRKRADYASRGILLGCGNPLLDITATVDEDFLRRYKLKPNDAILAEPRHTPLYRELAAMKGATFTAGGSVQNTLRVAQWLLGKPRCAVFFGSVGSDREASILAAAARSDGVDVRYQRQRGASTGTCGVMLTGHQRSLVTRLAAAQQFTVDHIQVPAHRNCMRRAEYYYTSGFLLTVSPATTMAMAEHALARNRMFLLNLGAPFIAQQFMEPLMAVMPFVDILFGNETEAAVFAAERGFGTDDLAAIVLRIARLPKRNAARDRTVIITQGSKAVLMAHKGRVHVVPVGELPAEQIVDTNGAGDAFVGGFLAQLVQKRSYREGIRCGIWAAQRIIQRSGCTFAGEATYVASDDLAEEEEVEDGGAI